MLPTGFLGECNHDITKDLEYMPSRDYLECIEKSPPEDWKFAKNAMYHRIDKLQNPKDCSNPTKGDPTEPVWKPAVDTKGFEIRRKGIKKEGKPKWNLLGYLHHGYGYNLFVLAWGAGNHWASDVPVLVGNSKYRFSDVKCGKHWSCLLSPLSKCTVDDVKDKSRILVYYGHHISRSLVMSYDQLCKPNGYLDEKNGRCVCDKGFMPTSKTEYSGCAPYHSFEFEKNPRRDWHRQVWEDEDPQVRAAVREGDDYYFSQIVPAETNPANTRYMHNFSMTRRKYGFLWEHAHWLWYLHKDAPLRPELDAAIKNLGLFSSEDINHKRTVGIHVRHGDSCHDVYQNHRKCYPLAYYMRLVKKLEDQYGPYDQIFLATDDPKVIEDATTLMIEDAQYKFVFQPIDRTIYENGDENGVDVRLEFNNPKLVRDIATDIWALAHCDALVVSFASSVAWVAYELLIARKGHYAPFISIDLAWGDKKNVGRFLKEPNLG